MYSPLNDLQKMWLTPRYIIFKVDIGGKVYYGRINNAICEPFDIVLSGKFEAYSSLLASQTGSTGEEIIVTPKEIIGLEAYDILSNKNPSPFSKIIACCWEIENIKKING